MEKYTIGIDLGTTTGVCLLWDDDTAVTHSIKHGASLAERVTGIAEVLENRNPDNCHGVCIEQPFGANARSLQALYSMMGACVLACEQKGFKWSVNNLKTIKKHATGNGNAGKPEMQSAALKRWGQTMGPDEADAAWVAAYAKDTGLFNE
jgi:Holliday junction resolvasome RuvABC endonuclease subunit